MNTKQGREIPYDNDGNPFLSIGELLSPCGNNRNRIVQIGVLATAIETHGIYTWDRYGRFRHFLGESAQGTKALDLLSYVYEYESNPEPCNDEKEHPLDHDFGWDNPYSAFGWAAEVAPDFSAISAQGSNYEKPIAQKSPQRIRDSSYIKTLAALLALWPKGKLPSGKDLENAADSVDVKISDDNIRNVLREATEFAPKLLPLK